MEQNAELHITLPQTLLTKLEAAASNGQIPLEDLVRAALEHYCETRDWARCMGRKFSPYPQKNSA